MSWFDGSGEAAAERHDVRALTARLLEVRRGLLDARSELTARLARLSGELEQIGEALESIHEQVGAVSALAEPAPPSAGAPSASADPRADEATDEVAEPEPAVTEAEPLPAVPERDLDREPVVAASLPVSEPSPLGSVVGTDPVVAREPNVPSDAETLHEGEAGGSAPAAQPGVEVEAGAPSGLDDAKQSGRDGAGRAGASPEEPDEEAAPLSPEEQRDQLLAAEFAVYRAPDAPASAPPSAVPEAERAASTTERGSEEAAPTPTGPTPAHTTDTDTDDFFANRGH